MGRLAGLAERPATEAEPSGRLTGLATSTPETPQEQEGGRLSRLARTDKSDRINRAMEHIIFSDIQKERQSDIVIRGEMAGLLADSFEDPDEQLDQLTSALLLSELFEISIDDATIMQPEMMKQLYGDETASIAKRFKQSPFEGGFFGKIAESYRRGDNAVGSDIAVYEAAFEGRGSVDTVLSARRKVQEDILLNPVEGNLVSGLFYKSANVVPGMAKGYWSAIPEAFSGMWVGIGAALAAGQAGPQVLAPEEIVTVPAGAVIGIRAGLAVGSATFWYKQGAGMMFASMIENGYDPEVSREVAGIAAVPYALLEFMQVRQLTPGLRKTMQTSLNTTMRKVMARAGKKYVGTLTTEVLEEIGQEIIQIGAEDIAGILSKVGITVNAEFLAERWARLWATAKESTQAMALLPLPGVAIDINTGRRKVLNQRQRAAINKKLNIMRNIPPDTQEQRAAVTPAGAPADTRLEPSGAPAEEVAETGELEPVGVRGVTEDVEGAEGVVVEASEDLVLLGREELKSKTRQLGLTDTNKSSKDLIVAIRRRQRFLRDQAAEPTATTVTRQIEPEAREIEAAVAAGKIETLQKEVVELEKLQAENKAREGTTQFDTGLGKFTTKQIVKKTKQIEEIKGRKPVGLALGLTRAEQQLLTPSQQKELREQQARGEKVGFKAGERVARERGKTEILKLQHKREVTEDLRNTARELVLEFVPKEKQGQFLTRVTKAKTQKDMRRIAAAIQDGISRAERRDSIDRLRNAAKAINPKKMLPEFAKTARAVLDSIQIGKLRLDTMIRNSDMKEMAQQVISQSRPESVAAVQAQQLLDELQEKTSRTFAINQLSVEAIDQITNTLIALRFQNELDTIAAKDENSTEAIRRRELVEKEIVEIPDVPASFGGQQVKKFKLFHDNMESVLDAVAGARAGTYDLWKKSKRLITKYVYDILDRGVDNQIIHSEKARNIVRDILNDNNVTQEDILNWSLRPEEVGVVKKAFGIAPKPQIHTFELSNVKDKPTDFDFTVNELMSIFMHTRNSHNLSVLLKDGFNRIVDGRKQKIRGFTIEVVEEMVDTLTEQQKKVARQVGSKLMDGFNKDAINETSVILEFFELADVVNYWPARRSITRIVRGRILSGTARLVEAMGLLKERVGTGNSMLLSGFFETVYSTNKNVAAYVGLAEPLREVKSVYNKDTIEAMENKGRAKEAELITDLIERFEGQAVLLGPLDKILKKMLGGFAKAALFLNIKIAPRQQISSFLISAYVDTKYITEFRGLQTKEITEEISKLSPQTKARFEQLQFDRDIGDAFIENELMNYLSGKTTLIDKTAVGMKFFDQNAIEDVYRAVKAEVIDKNPDVNIDSTEGKALLKERFEWVVRHTQPMWHPKDRSKIGSDPNVFIRSLTMFMSQREQLVRMVNNSIADFVNSKKTGDDAARMGRALGTIALNLAAFTLYNFAWATLIQKKKKDVSDLIKMFLTDILSLPFFGKYIAKSTEITFNVLTDKPVFREDFSDGPIETNLRLILLESIPNFARAGKHFVTKEKYKSGPNRGKEKWTIELFVAVDALVEAVASLKGIPYRGAKSIGKIVKAQLPEEKPTRKPLFTGTKK